MAVVVPIISTFDSQGIDKAVRDFKKLDTIGEKTAFTFLNGTKFINNMGETFAKVGAIGLTFAGIIGKQLVDAAYESQKMMAQTEAIILATGGAAGLTADDVDKLSQALAVQTGVDDELIQKSLNLLLTFKRVQNQAGEGNDIFTRASSAILDMGNVFGSTDAAAKQLGKALSDPEKGITALKKSGIDFTEQQKEQIKTMVDAGDVLGAQKLILKEIETQVGGTAAASATGFDRMKVAISNVAEDLGDLLIPYVERFSNFVISTVIPKMQEFASIVGKNGLGAGFKYLGEQAVTVIENLGGFGTLVFGVVSAFAALNVGMAIYTTLTTASTIATALFGVTLNVALAGIPALIGILVVGIAALMVKSKGFREFMMTVFRNVASAVQDGINIAISAINLFIRAYNGIPFLDGVNELGKVKIGFANSGKQAVATAADFRKFEEGQKNLLPAIIKNNNELRNKNTTMKDASEKVKKASENFEKFETALSSATNAGRSLADATKAIGKAQFDLSDATTKVKDAQEKLNKITNGYALDSKEVLKATADLTDLQRDAIRSTSGLADATSKVKDAQEKLDKVMKGYGANSKEVLKATADLTDLQRDAVRSGYALADAQQAVLNAQQKIIDLNTPASARSIQEATDDLTQAMFNQSDAEAELAEARAGGKQREITEAEIALRDAINDVADAQSKLTDLQKPVDAEALADAEDELALAELNLLEALDDKAEAYKKVSDAQTLVNELTNGASETSDTYRDALKELKEAQEDQADALINSEEANKKVSDAQAILNELVNGAATSSDTYRDALIELQKAQRDEADAIDNLSDAKYREFEATKALAKANLLLQKSRSLLTPAQLAAAEKLADEMIMPDIRRSTPSATPAFPDVSDLLKNIPALDYSNILNGINIEIGGIATLASGGVVTKPTLSLVGEGGQSEAVIPLDRLGSMGGGGNYTINITGGLSSSAEIGQAVVNAIKSFNVVNGPARISVA